MWAYQFLCVCVEADRAALCQHHHNHQKSGEGGPMSWGKGLVCSWHPFWSTCATYLPGKCSWSEQVSTTKFTKMMMMI